MKRAVLGVFVFSIFFFVTCQKEIDWGLGGGGAAGKLLVKVSSKTGTDTSVVTYSYDASKKIVGEKTVGISGGTSIDNELIINRNASSIITTTVQKAAALLTVGIDSIVILYNYNPTTSQYSSSVFSITAFGVTVADSAVYTYNGSGKITADAHYLKTGFLPPLLSLKNDYTYSVNGQNLAGMQQLGSSIPGGPLSPVSAQVYTYDTKTNPLIVQNEAILLSRTGLYNTNNVLKNVFTNTANPASGFTMDYVFKYNNAGKPDSSYATRTPGGAVTASKYLYQ